MTLSTPVYYPAASLRLIEEVISTIQDRLKLIPWMDNVFGLVQKGIHKDGLEYPMTYPYSKTNPDSDDIRPRSDWKSYCFFEVEDPINANDEMNKATLNLIVWGNLDTIHSTRTNDFTSELIEDVTKRVKECYPLLDIDIYNIRFFTRNEDVFNYSGIQQAKTQYLMKPYFGFKIQFDCFYPICK